MKNRVGSLQLFIIKDDGSENYLFQDSTLTQSPFHSGPEFNFYKRQNEGHSWQKIYKDGRNPYMEWGTFYGDMWGQPITINTSGQYIVDTETRRSQYRREYTATIDEVGIGDLFVSSVDAPGRRVTVSSSRPEPSAFAVRREVELDELRRQFNEGQNELRRRAQQRAADLQRQEEERNRPRRPWDRVRDMFRG